MTNQNFVGILARKYMSAYFTGRRDFLRLALTASCMPLFPRFALGSSYLEDERTAWYRAAKFGMFIHWGVYSALAGTYEGKKIPGIGEWIMNTAKIPIDKYKPYAKLFNPVKYNPEAWVKMARNAGVKYIVITSKHHNGFALFDSKVTDWDIVDASPYGKDLLKPLVAACRKEGIRIASSVISPCNIDIIT